jgi:hypothetical protein
MQSAFGIGVDGPRDRKRRGHLSIAEGGEQHGHETNHAGQWHQALRHIEHDAENGERGDWGSEDEPVDEEIAGTQATPPLQVVEGAGQKSWLGGRDSNSSRRVSKLVMARDLP